MTRKIKNKDLEELLSNLELLRNYPMPGEMSLAVIEARNKLMNAFNAYMQACKQIGESKCEVDKSGKPISMFQTDEKGNKLINLPKKLKFKDETIEETAIFEAKKAGEEFIEIELIEVHKSTIENLKNITPIQMEAILSIIAIK